MAYDPNRSSVLMFGGGNSNFFQQDTWLWDGQNWTAAPLNPVSNPIPRVGMALATDPVRSRVVMYGGIRGYMSNDILGDTWEWDGQQWTELFPVVTPRERVGHRMAWSPTNEKILLFGGGDLVVTFNDAFWMWDGTIWSQSQTVFPWPRIQHVLCEMPNGRVLLHGGSVKDPATNRTVYPRDTWEWDGQVWHAIATNHYPGYRQAPQAAPFPPTQSVVLHDGGMSNTPHRSSDPGDRDDSTWVYTNQDWQRVSRDEAEPTDFRGTAVDSAREQVILMSTRYGTAPYTFETWLLEGERLRRAVTPVAPPWRSAFGIGYHPVRREVVLCGGHGYGGHRLNDTWVWDGVTWREDTSANRPIPFNNTATMTFLPDRGTLAMVTGLENEIWEWNGAGWTEYVQARLPFPVPPPPATSGDRGVRKIAYDSTRGVLTCFHRLVGGISVWTFQNSVWTQRTSDDLCCPVYDVADVPELGGIVAVSPERAHETWLWDGTGWTQLPLSRQLFDGWQHPSYDYPMLAYDRSRGMLRAFRPAACFSGRVPSYSAVWNLEVRNLTMRTQLPRLGERIVYDLFVPQEPFGWAPLLFSTGLWPGVPVPGLGDRRLPLANDPVLQNSLGIATFFLDAQGRASVALPPIPNNRSLVGWHLHATAPVLSARNGSLMLTNVVELNIQR